MNLIFTLSLIFLLTIVGCQSSKLTESKSPSQLAPVTISPSSFDPVTIEIFNSIRITKHRIKITLETTGKMDWEIQDRGQKSRISTTTISSEEVTRIQSLLQRIDWEEVSEDDTIGLDGSSLLVTYRTNKYSLWTPSSDTAKRGLDDILLLKNELFRMAGLN